MKIPVRIVKLLPRKRKCRPGAGHTIYRRRRLLMLKAKITTRENGTDEVILSYGKYARNPPCRTKSYFPSTPRITNFPRALHLITMTAPRKKNPPEIRKTSAEKSRSAYHAYEINKGLKDDVFK